MDPLREVALSISNETPEAGIARPSAGKTVPLQRADREAEDSCRLLLVKKTIHAVFCRYNSVAELKILHREVVWMLLAQL